MAGTALPVVRADLVRLAHRGLGLREFALSSAALIRRIVPFDGVCLLTMDPATLVPTGEIVENGLPAATIPRMTEIELTEPDFNKFADLARRPRPAASLSEATAGNLDRSLRHHEVKRPNGFGDELRAALASGSATWGGLTLLRERGRAHFRPADAAVVASLSAPVVEGLQRAALLAAEDGSCDDHRGDVGLLLLASDGSVATANATARVWLSELGHADADGPPPSVIRAVARRARDVEADGGPPASGRIRTAAGRWLLVRGAMLGGQAAVILEPARRPELAPLIEDAYGLTDRERALTALVVRGLSTKEIAAHLHLSPYTVQDHLRSIFEKTGVSTRAELVARLFLAD
jgi:DNA-binding CsgD family transcriptional regulator